MTIKWPERGDVYAHYKGDLYVVIGIAHSHEGERCVVYTPLSEWRHDHRNLYMQPVGRFTQTLANHEPRFEYNGRNLL